MTKYVFDFVAPGLNVMLREHFSKRKKRKETIQWCIIQQGLVNHKGRVELTYKRTSRRLLDDDNNAASAKSFLDALVKCGVIVDDSRKTIPNGIKFEQEKGDDKTEIIIASLTELLQLA